MDIMNSPPLAQSFPLGSVERIAINSAYLSVFRTLILMAIVTSALTFLAILGMGDITVSGDENQQSAPAVDSEERDVKA